MIKVAIKLIAVLLLTGTAQAAAPSGKAIAVSGQVTRVSQTSKSQPLKVDDSVYEGDQLTSSDHGSAKLLLTDQTELELAPSSKLRIDAVKSDGPGLITIGAGNVRTKVKKGHDGQIKLLIRTRAVTAGVRGTDFLTITNKDTQLTSLVTFDGQVAFSKNEPTQAAQPTIRSMMGALSNPDQAVLINRGEISAATPGQDLKMIPVKISPAQLQSLQNVSVTTASGAATSTGGVKPESSKTIGSTVPPGVPADAVSGGSLADLSKATGIQVTPTQTADNGAPPAEGFYDAKSKTVAPPSGGFVDLKTGLYIPPPPGSAKDPVTGAYLPPPNMGGFDAKTGAYLPPPGFTLDAQKGFISNDSGGSPSGQGALSGPPPLFGGLRPESAGRMDLPPPPPGANPIAFGAGSGPAGASGPPPGAPPPPNMPGFDYGQPDKPLTNPYNCPPNCNDGLRNPDPSQRTQVTVRIN